MNLTVMVGSAMNHCSVVHVKDHEDLERVAVVVNKMKLM